MDSSFLLKTLKAFGFDPIFCNWIKVILHLAKVSILVNGHAVGFFSCKRGVRQGDPLSPLLFCIAKDILSRAISLMVQQGKLHPMSSLRGYAVPTHVLYADDLMIFCKGSMRNMQNLISVCNKYNVASGQVISNEKSKIYNGFIPHNRLSSIVSILGFGISHLPFVYLGVPLFKGKPRKVHLQPIADRIRLKLATWKGALLSIMRRVQLVQSVIHSTVLHSFHIYGWPSSLLKMTDKWIRNFV